jgi:hypothetical protein
MEVQMGVGLVEKGLTFPYLAPLRGTRVAAEVDLGMELVALADPALAVMAGSR